MTTPEPNTALALAFLDILDKNGRHDLFAIGANGQTKAATFLPNDNGDSRPWINAQVKNRNVYVSINEGREDESIDWRLSKAHIGAVRAIAVDLDPKKLDAKGAGDPGGDNFRTERARLLQAVKTLCADPLHPPSLVVDSGGGYWLLWLLASKVTVTPEVFTLAEGISRTLAERFGGDSTFDLSRVMRLPGTINLPDAKKAEQGRTPTLSTIPTEFISDKRYTLDQLAKWAPPTSEKAAVKDRPKSPIDWDAVEADTYDELHAELLEKFAALRKQHTDVDKLWGGVPLPRQKDESSSGFEYALAGELRRSGNFTPTSSHKFATCGTTSR